MFGDDRHGSDLAQGLQEETLPHSDVGIYAWPKEGKPKQPFALKLANGQTFALAGATVIGAQGAMHNGATNSPSSFTIVYRESQFLR